MLGAILSIIGSVFTTWTGMFAADAATKYLARAAFAAFVIASVGAVYVAYSAAINALSVSLPAEFRWAMIFIPPNAAACLTAVTTMRISLFLLSLKMGLSSLAVS